MKFYILIMLAAMYVTSFPLLGESTYSSKRKHVGRYTIGREGGGGNGIDGIILEDYSKDIKELLEYRHYVNPIMVKLKQIIPELADDLEEIYFMKSFYFVPVPLETIPSEVIGVSFPTDQLALQSFNSVWIDTFYYLQRSEKVKAKLLVHELVMGLRMDMLTNSYMSLEEKDYDAIRRLTNALMNEIEKLSTQKLVQLISNLGFKKYKIADQIIDNDSNIYKVPSLLELYKGLESENAQRNLPYTTKNKKGCAYSFVFDQKMESLTINIYDGNSGVPRLDLLPFSITVNVKPYVNKEKTKVHYEFNANVDTPTGEFRKRVVLTLNDSRFIEIKAEWQQYFFNFMTRSYEWKSASKPETTTSPDSKYCLGYN